MASSSSEEKDASSTEIPDGASSSSETENETETERTSASSSRADQLPLLRPESPCRSSATSPSPPPPPSGPDLADLDAKYAAYVRRDSYGTLGLGPFSLFPEKILLAVASVTLVPLRFLVALVILVVYYVICRFSTAFAADGYDFQDDLVRVLGWRRALIVSSGRFCSRALLFTLGFYSIHVSFRPCDAHAHKNVSKNQSEELERPGAIVSNHVSYLDILYHMSSSFPSFVAKRETKASGFKGVSGPVTSRVHAAHQNKDSPIMLLFPEGTTTNGDYLLPFKTGAFLAKAPVLPVIIRYPYQRFSPAWDTISGVRHLLLLLCQFVNYIEVIQMPVYYPSDQEKEDPKLYADNVRKLMANEGNLVLSEIGLPEKRVYHAALNGLFCQG